MQLPNLKHLEAFCEVAEQHSFTGAADQLYISQSTISSHVASLEKELGMTLLTRATKRGTGVSLTAEGRRVYAYAKNILQNCEYLSMELTKESSRELILGASSIPMLYVLPRLLSDFAAIQPGCRFILHQGDSREVHDLVLNGEVHLGLAGAVFNEQELHYNCICRDSLVLLAPDTPHYQSLRSESRSGNELLLHEPLLFRRTGSGTQALVQSFLSGNDIKMNQLNIIAQVDNSETLLELVHCGLGCAVISDKAARTRPDLLTFSLEGNNTSRSLYMLRLKNSRPPRIARLFIDFILSDGQRI